MSENPLGRWPGYDEQSWQQRFTELDRRHSSVGNRLIQAVFAADKAGYRRGLADAAKTIAERKAIYEAKREGADHFNEEWSEADRIEYTIEAHECLSVAILALVGGGAA